MRSVQRRWISLMKVVAVGGSLAAAGFGSAVAADGAAAATGAHAATATSVKVASSKLGKILVGPNGRTLYMYKVDKGTTSECYGQCLSYWPALLTKGKPSAGSGVKGSKLGTTKRKNGTLQVTYAGHPLYYFSGDKGAGTENGQGSEGAWYVLSPSGAVVSQAASSGSSGY